MLNRWKPIDKKLLVITYITLVGGIMCLRFLDHPIEATKLDTVNYQVMQTNPSEATVTPPINRDQGSNYY